MGTSSKSGIISPHFERERVRMEGSRKSGAGSDDVYQTKWPYYGLVEFCLDKSFPDQVVSTMNHNAPSVKKSKKEKIEEKNTKLFEVIADRLSRDNTPADNGNWHGSKASKQDFSRHGSSVRKCSCNSRLTHIHYLPTLD